MDHAKTGRKCIKRGLKIDLFAIDQNITTVTTGIPNFVHTKQNFHQRTFSGTVFTDKTQHFTLMECQVDIHQHLIAEKVLFDVFHLQ